MKNDKVMVGLGGVQMSDANIPIYELNVDGQGKHILDANGAVTVKPPTQGVKGKSTGHIAGDPVKVLKASLAGMNNTTALGLEYVNLYPIYFDYYKATAWVFQDHVHIVGEVYGKR